MASGGHVTVNLSTLVTGTGTSYGKPCVFCVCFFNEFTINETLI
jgi:hypothetical protein